MENGGRSFEPGREREREKGLPCGRRGQKGTVALRSSTLFLMSSHAHSHLSLSLSISKRSRIEKSKSNEKKKKLENMGTRAGNNGGGPLSLNLKRAAGLPLPLPPLLRVKTILSNNLSLSVFIDVSNCDYQLNSCSKAVIWISGYKIDCMSERILNFEMLLWHYYSLVNSHSRCPYNI